MARALAEFGEAQAYYEESLTIRRQVDDQYGIAHSLNNLGDIAQAAGQTSEARQLYQESLSILRELKAESVGAHPLSGLGRLARDDGDYQAALSYYREALQPLQPDSNVPIVLNVLFEVVTLLVEMEEEMPLAQSLLHLVYEHPKTSEETKQAAEQYPMIDSSPPFRLTLAEAVAAVMQLAYQAEVS